jgi:hypothetical protein
MLQFVLCEGYFTKPSIPIPMTEGLEFETQQKKLSKKLSPVTGSGGLYCYEMLRIPHCLDSRLKDSGKVVSLMHRPRSTQQKHFSASGTRFC